jgi:hypothetical protein
LPVQSSNIGVQSLQAASIGQNVVGQLKSQSSGSLGGDDASDLVEV